VYTPRRLVGALLLALDVSKVANTASMPKKARPAAVEVSLDLVNDRPRLLQPATAVALSAGSLPLRSCAMSRGPTTGTPATFHENVTLMPGCRQLMLIVSQLVLLEAQLKAQQQSFCLIVWTREAG